MSDFKPVNKANERTSLHNVPDRWVSRGIITPPPSIAMNSDSEVIVTSLHWSRTKYSDSTLLIAYLHHGILYKPS